MSNSKNKASVALSEEELSSIKESILVEDFPVVGIGSSAGGLEALEGFFKNLPENCNIAFVVIQHLDPTRKGILPELIQRFTSLKVIPVENNLLVKPNSIYVIPSNTSLSISNRILHLEDPIETRGLRLPIDFFFKSLAEDLHDKSVGIILSGMGSDGSLGLKSIKANSGLVLVQDPENAKFNSMPQSAIDSVPVDFVGAAEDLSLKLINYIENKPIIEFPIENNASLNKIISMLHSSKGHDFSQYKNNTLNRRIEKRMNLHQILKTSDYISYLEDNPEELDFLFKDILIGVTNFFRDSSVWEKLSEDILPEIFSKLPNGYTFRVWVTGCSSGEEAYSLAITFKEVLEKIEPSKKIIFKIFATDIDVQAIDKARKAIYPDYTLSGLSEERLGRYFVKTDSGFRVITTIREMVVFAPHNITKDPPFAKLDFISCRNMLIYMQLELQQKLLRLFNFCLNPDGLLLLGGSESLGTISTLFKTIDSKSKIYKKNTDSKIKEISDFSSSFSHFINPDTKKMTATKSTDLIQVLADQLLLQQFSPPSVMTNENGDIIYITGHTGNYLEPAAGKANMNIFVMARDGLKNRLTIGFNEATHSYKPITLKNIKIDLGNDSILVNVTIQKIEKPEQLHGLFLFVFSEINSINGADLKIKKGKTDKKNDSSQSSDSEYTKLKEELQLTIEQNQTSKEELNLANEELQSSNEELQSTNEELTTSKEEMQSLNEELQSVNLELQNKIDEYIHINNDLKNLFESTDIAILFLDKNMNIRRFTRQTTSILKLIQSDVGRPFTDISTDLDYPEISKDVQEVLRTLVFIEKNVRTFDSRWFNIRILPYRTIDDRIDGLVITFSDITQAKNLEDELKRTNEELLSNNKNLIKSENNYKKLFQEKKLLLKEVHHRIKNNLSTILSILKLQADTQDTLLAKNALLDSASRVHSMMILYDKLYCTETFTQVNLKEYFPAFVNEIVNTFNKKPPIKVNINVDNIILNINTISPFGIIITELITNSMKYAFNGENQGEINISALAVGNHLTITFEDNGPGFPEDLTIQNSNGFGILLINTLVQQLNGTITLGKGKSAKYIIEFEI